MEEDLKRLIQNMETLLHSYKHFDKNAFSSPEALLCGFKLFRHIAQENRKRCEYSVPDYLVDALELDNLSKDVEP
jgi:hypothetical protein